MNLTRLDIYGCICAIIFLVFEFFRNYFFWKCPVFHHSQTGSGNIFGVWQQCTCEHRSNLPLRSNKCHENDGGQYNVWRSIVAPTNAFSLEKKHLTIVWNGRCSLPRAYQWTISNEFWLPIASHSLWSEIISVGTWEKRFMMHGCWRTTGVCGFLLRRHLPLIGLFDMKHRMIQKKVVRWFIDHFHCGPGGSSCCPDMAPPKMVMIKTYLLHLRQAVIFEKRKAKPSKLCSWIFFLGWLLILVNILNQFQWIGCCVC